MSLQLLCGWRDESVPLKIRSCAHLNEDNCSHHFLTDVNFCKITDLVSKAQLVEVAPLCWVLMFELNI